MSWDWEDVKRFCLGFFLILIMILGIAYLINDNRNYNSAEKECSKFFDDAGTIKIIAHNKFLCTNVLTDEKFVISK